MKVLLSEASSLTAREHLSVLGPAGVEVHALSSSALPLSRFSRWCKGIIRVPAVAEDPVGYLAAVAQSMSCEMYDALLPTHEQAWLFAAGRHLLPPDLKVAVAPIAAFDRVQSKIAFCALLAEIGLPQPDYAIARNAGEVAALGFPCWIKSAFSNSGRGVRYAKDADQAAAAFLELGGVRDAILIQRPAAGVYAQVAALFAHGSLVAVHCSEQVGAGAGGSAAARIGVDHPAVRAHVARLGAFLGWHGGLTLDYLHVEGAAQFIECNPRTVEPGNAAASEVNLPLLSIAVARGDALPKEPVVGIAGRRTHGSMALMLGAAERTGQRVPALRALAAGLGRRGAYRESTEVLTPLFADPWSVVPVLVTASQVMARPRAVAAIAASAVRSYAVPPEAVEMVREKEASYGKKPGLAASFDAAGG